PFSPHFRGGLPHGLQDEVKRRSSGMAKTKISSDRKKQLSIRIDAALGKVPADLVFKNVRFLDVFRGEWREGDVAVKDGVIVGTDEGYRGEREIEARGKFLVPGFIDAHVHLESSLMAPGEFQRSVLKCGTTTAICDPHEL